MPRPKPKVYDRLNAFVKELSKTIFSTDKSILYCKLCDIKISAKKRFTVLQHVKTTQHIEGINRQQLKSINKNSTTCFYFFYKEERF